MSIRKDFIGSTAFFSGTLPLDMLCSFTGHDFILPFYHIVSDEECPHIKNLYRFKNVKQFESDIDYLASHYSPIGPEVLPDVIAGKYKGKKIMLLSFDDGLRQMYEIVAPILIRKGIPAVFFLNTDFIDNKALMFRYKASLIKHMGWGTDPLLKARNDVELKKELDPSITAKVETALQSFLADYKPYMTADQIQSLITQGFTIGAHSRSHPYYEYLTLSQQLSETFDCLDILKRDFLIKQNLFAFPFTDHGVSKAFFDQIFDSGKVDFSFGGAGIKNDINPRQLQRIPMEGWDASAEQILKSEYLYYLLRATLGKNTIVRK